MKEETEKIYNHVKGYFKSVKGDYVDYPMGLPGSFLVIAYLSGYCPAMTVEQAHKIVEKLVEEKVVAW